MPISDFLRKNATALQNDGVALTAQSITREIWEKKVLSKYLQRRQRRFRTELPHQRPLLDELRERDRWCLIVFDAGRYDYLAPLLSDHYTGNVQQVYSDARDTFEWISTTWDGDYSDVTYLSGMVPVAESTNHFDSDWYNDLYAANPADSIGEIVKAWETEWDNTLGTVTPEDITEMALKYADRDKLVVHYNQPHSPFIGTPKLLGYTTGKSVKPNAGNAVDQPIWERVRSGDVSDEYLRMAYWGNAERAIAAVDPLVRERETVVATSDHGEALGEWGLYAHKRDPHPQRRSVPWMELTGVRERGRSTASGESVDEKLRALGYR